MPVLPQKICRFIFKGIGNCISLIAFLPLFAVDNTLIKLANFIDLWADIIGARNEGDTQAQNKLLFCKSNEQMKYYLPTKESTLAESALSSWSPQGRPNKEKLLWDSTLQNEEIQNEAEMYFSNNTQPDRIHWPFPRTFP